VPFKYRFGCIYISGRFNGGIRGVHPLGLPHIKKRKKERKDKE
jgi:hypothetical protein